MPDETPPGREWERATYPHATEEEITLLFQIRAPIRDLFNSALGRKRQQRTRPQTAPTVTQSVTPPAKDNDK